MSQPLALIVDDDPAIRDVLVGALADEGFATVQAANGQEALERVEERLPRVIFLDMRMPVMDGWTFAREYRRRFGARAPLIVMTAATHARAWAAEVDADAVLAKPFDINDLLGTVATCVKP